MKLQRAKTSSNEFECNTLFRQSFSNSGGNRDRGREESRTRSGRPTRLTANSNARNRIPASACVRHPKINLEYKKTHFSCTFYRVVFCVCLISEWKTQLESTPGPAQSVCCCRRIEEKLC
eukprot:1067972-Rhodomonas_salina.1